jgi:outer membrane PBP1 activator LpoA protein
MLSGCQNTPSPREETFPSAADTLTHPKRIALLLPLQGELGAQGAAVREGFFAAHYVHAQNKTVELPKISVYDTKGDKDVLNAYQRALTQGADFIVGPLTKPGLETLMKAGNPSVPMLALNNIDMEYDSLYQYALSPENEATQAGIRAYEKGNRNALLFIQEGSWGSRVADAFRRSFERKGGDVADIIYFNTRDNLSDVVRKALHIDQAEMAALDKAMRTKNPVQFPVKRRDDVDMVFMAAMPNEARQIPPLLSFYFAKSWPVYATASVYSGKPNPKADHDLNGVTFCDIPWLIEVPQHNPAGTPDTVVMQLWPKEPRAQTRLYGMGVDAYELVPMLRQMSHQSRYTFDGATGMLSMNNRQQIERTLPCTQFVQGVPVKISGP